MPPALIHWWMFCKVATLTALVDQSLIQSRFAMLLLAAYGALALVLASIGMYGVISHSVT